MKKLFLYIGFLLLLRPSFGQEVFQYSITSHPKDSAVGCEPVAQEIGRKFSALTGKTVFRVTCDADTFLGYDITVTYVSDSKISYVSTKNESGGNIGFLGGYRSRQECERNLSQEIQWFEESTGLKRFLAYCYSESNSYPTPFSAPESEGTYFAAYVDGFGAARLYPYRFEIDLGGRVISSGLEKKLFDLTLSMGIQVKQVAVAQPGGGRKLVIRYYDSPRNTPFRHGYFVYPNLESGLGAVAMFRSQEDCLFSGEKVLGSFSSAFTDRSVWFCALDTLGFNASLYLVYVKPRNLFEGDLVPLRYDSFQQCEADRLNVIEFYKSQLKKDILGGLCTWRNISYFPSRPEGYYLQVFSEIKEGT